MAELTTTQKVTSGSALLLSILAIVMSSGLIGQDSVYACEDLNLGMPCPEGLSKVNDYGLQTNCKYFSETLNRSTYKRCKSGWLKYTPIIKEDIIIVNKTNSNVSIENVDWTMCKIVRGNNFIKECINKLNESELYIIRF